ncbi:uncharacterized protein LOC121996959 [Zingiber officinale]|uniref:Uncharacterized protein n=1 Tax=Zingiber officinale TaxID=94328 RepID=A0A8J5G4R1_ZINOF|nr:uncharacterized protein LOC121996959 [Zingiber officinale]KAG6500370.1 hypothetical protein ZIOFF_040215 [Zingiber officinale]
MEGSGDLKRHREEESPEISSPEAKRLRDDLFFEDILDGDDAGAGDQDLASVMKSLEDEIGLPSPLPTQTEADMVTGLPDLGYLFEASDDELGLPPAPPMAPNSDEATVVSTTVVQEGEVEGNGGFDPIWGLDDEINGYYGMEEFGMRLERPLVGTDDGVVFDVGLFDFSDMSWRSETLPAI